MSSRGIRQWDAETGRAIGQIANPDPQVNSIALSPDGRFVAVAVAKDLTIRLWHIASGHEVAQMQARRMNRTHWLSHLMDGYWLPEAVTTPRARINPCGSGSSPRAARCGGLPGIAGVTGLAFLPDNRRLIHVAPTRRPSSGTLRSRARTAPLAASHLSLIDAGTIWPAPMRPKRITRSGPWSWIPIGPCRSWPIGSSRFGLMIGRKIRRSARLPRARRCGGYGRSQYWRRPEHATAREALGRMAAGLEGARETREARAAIRRLE